MVLKNLKKIFLPILKNKNTEVCNNSDIHYSETSNYGEDRELGYADLVSVTPSIDIIDLSKLPKHQTDVKNLMLLGSDGVFDSFSNDDSLLRLCDSIYRDFYERRLSLPDKQLINISRNVVFEAFDRGSNDNITAMIVEL